MTQVLANTPDSQKTSLGFGPERKNTSSFHGPREYQITKTSRSQRYLTGLNKTFSTCYRSPHTWRALIPNQEIYSRKMPRMHFANGDPPGCHSCISTLQRRTGKKASPSLFLNKGRTTPSRYGSLSLTTYSEESAMPDSKSPDLLLSSIS